VVAIGYATSAGLLLSSWIDGPAATLLLVGAVITAATATLIAIVKIWRFVQVVVNFFKDWNGDPERPGVPGHQGVMPRLLSMEERQIASEENQNVILGIITPNGGSSLRDTVDRIDARSELSARQTLLIKRLLKAHLIDGITLMEIGIENDSELLETLRKHGIEVAYRDVQDIQLAETRKLLAQFEELDLQ
jgi:hypothetical protein